MNIDNLVAALGDALVGAGLERPRPPRDLTWLEEINATVAPLRLPEQLAGERHIPADVDAARNSSDDPHEQLARVLLARHGGPVDAVATAVRPLAPAS
jgi:hypothetical protein